MRLVAVFCKEGTFAFFFFPSKSPVSPFLRSPKKKGRALYNERPLMTKKEERHRSPRTASTAYSHSVLLVRTHR